MATREIKIGLMSYARANSPEDTVLWGFGLMGEEVDVAEHDLERFDRLNATAAAPVAPLPKAVESDEPPRAGRGSSLDAWLDYALEIGLPVPSGATRDEVIDLVDSNK